MKKCRNPVGKIVQELGKGGEALGSNMKRRQKKALPKKWGGLA